MATSIPQKPPPPAPKPKVETAAARPDAAKSPTTSRTDAAAKPTAASRPATAQSAPAPAKLDPARLRMADGFEAAPPRPQASSGGSSFTPAQASAVRPANDASQQLGSQMADAFARLGDLRPSSPPLMVEGGKGGAAGGIADRAELMGLGRPAAGAAGGIADRGNLSAAIPRAGAAGGIADYFPSAGSSRGVGAQGNDQDLSNFLDALSNGGGGLFQPAPGAFEPLITFPTQGNGNFGGWMDFGDQGSGGGGAAGGIADRWGN